MTSLVAAGLGSHRPFGGTSRKPIVSIVAEGTAPTAKGLRNGGGILGVVAETLRLTIAFDEPDEEGWIVARVIEVPGALSQGRTRAEARENVIDALRLVLSPDDRDPRVGEDRSERLELTLVA